MAFLSKLPKTEHDLSTFTLDVPFTRFQIHHHDFLLLSQKLSIFLIENLNQYIYIFVQPEFDDVHGDGAFQRERHKAERVH